MILIIFFAFVSIASAYTERESIMNNTHTLSWGYFYTIPFPENPNYLIWYISPTAWYGDVYALTPIKDGKAGWGTVGEDVATIDLENNQISISDNLDSDPSDRYYDAGWREWTENSNIHLYRQWVQGQTVPIRWYFFYVKETYSWYIINAPGNGEGTSILKFSEKDGQYDWIATDTKDLAPIFFLNNDQLYLQFEKNTEPAKAIITDPPEGSILEYPGQVFTRNDTGAEGYCIYVGSTPGGREYNFQWFTNSSIYLRNLPNDGSPVYVRLCTSIDGEWACNDYTYTAFDDSSNLVLEDPGEEKYNPTLISPTTEGSFLTNLDPGSNHFKFVVEPGYSYSFIVNTNNYDHNLESFSAVHRVIHFQNGFQLQIGGSPKPDHGIEGNYSYAKSAAMFDADFNYYPDKYYNYVRIVTWDYVPNTHIRLEKKPEKYFGYPFDGYHTYYNAFGHRALINNDTYLTQNGHDGIDICAYNYTSSGWEIDYNRPAIPIADGEVVKRIDLGSGLGYAIWVYHATGGGAYTSLYAHLQNPQVSVGDFVFKGQTALGYISTVQNHMHLEIFKNYNIGWYNGYSNGSGGQIDPLSVLFDE